MKINKKIILFFILVLNILCTSIISISQVNKLDNGDSKNLDKVIQGQSFLIKKVCNADLTNEQRVVCVLEMLSPLGVLDPFAKAPNEGIDTILNLLTGFHLASVGLDEESVQGFVQLPLKQGMEFDYQNFFLENKDNFQKILKTFDENKWLHILGVWQAKLSRINNIVFDHSNNIVWKMEENGSYFQYDNFKYVPLDTQMEFVEKIPELKKIEPTIVTYLTSALMSSRVKTVYRCEGKVIVIMKGLSDNAYGFIHGASTASEGLDCGLLSNRFEIKKEEKLEDGWIFWVSS